MRSRQEFINDYQRSHLHPLNQWIHIFCVPLIFVSSAGLMWSVSLARFFPEAGPALAPWLNLAVLVSLPILFFYARLGLSSFVSGLAWTLVSAAVCLAIQGAGWPLAWISGATWVLAWAVQFYGHEVEGARRPIPVARPSRRRVSKRLGTSGSASVSRRSMRPCDSFSHARRRAASG